jgi:predicted nucleotidyltransferase
LSLCRARKRSYAVARTGSAHRAGRVEGVFERHTLEKGALYHPTLTVGDVNADSEADIIVGNMVMAGAVEVWVEVWVQR